MRVVVSASLLIALTVWALPVTVSSTLSPVFAASIHPFVDGVLLVKFRKDVPAEAIEALNRQFGTSTIAMNQSIGVHRLSVPAGRSALEMVALYRGLQDVEFAEPDYVAQIADTMPNDTYFPLQWGPAKIQMPAAWDMVKGTTSILMAVVDTGVDWTHPDLQARFIQGYNFFDRNRNTQDDNGHGTHVAGIIGALTNNATGIAGVTWQLTILPVKVLGSGGSGSYYMIADGITYAADRGAKVINLSLGGGSDSNTLRAAVDYAWNKGALLACAAGNTNGGVIYPAAYAGCMAVSATDENDQKAWFSSFGPQVEVAAPGVNVLSTVPSGSCMFCDPSGYRYLSGTSMATPHVAGLAALLLGEFPGATNLDVRNQMKAQSDDLGDPGVDQYFGSGRINAYKAVANPLGWTPTPMSVKITSPGDGSTVSGSVAITATISGGVAPFRVVVTVEGKGKAKTICDSLTAQSAVSCQWNTSKGGGPGPYNIAVTASGSGQATDTVTVTVTK